jgi:hypothetical protein
VAHDGRLLGHVLFDAAGARPIGSWRTSDCGRQGLTTIGRDL